MDEETEEDDPELSGRLWRYREEACVYTTRILLNVAEDGPSYRGYSLVGFPRAALPSCKKNHTGRHSYTCQLGSARIEVLLRQKAFYVKNGPNKGQVSWNKHGGIKNAWIAACGKSGVLPFPKRRQVKK